MFFSNHFSSRENQMSEQRKSTNVTEMSKFDPSNYKLQQNLLCSNGVYMNEMHTVVLSILIQLENVNFLSVHSVL